MAKSRAVDPGKKVLVSTIKALRKAGVPGWTPANLHKAFSVEQRLTWLTDANEIRATITHSLTGLAKSAAGAQPPDVQASLIEATLKAGDTKIADVDAAFETQPLVEHGDLDALWSHFLGRFPWDKNGRNERKILTHVLDALLATGLLSALDIRRNVEVTAWQSHLPTETRAEIDSARINAEIAGKPFVAADELAIATAEVLCRSLPLVALRPVFEAVSMGKKANGRKKRPRLSALAKSTSDELKTPPDLSFDFNDQAEGAVETIEAVMN